MKRESIGKFLAILFLASAARAQTGGKPLDVYFIDVEGGASTLIVTPAGQSVLVDTGNPGARDPGRILEATKLAGLKKIDFLVITHYHADHFGGAADLQPLIPFGTIYDNADENPSRDRPTTQYTQIPADKKVMIKPGDFLPIEQGPGPKLTIQCLAARKKFIDPPATAKPNPFDAESRGKPIDLTDNANSIVQLISFGDFRFYDGGDLTWNMEHDLVTPLNRVGTVDVYQVTHHGLAQSNNPVLVKAIEPTVAIMNNGVTKGCEPETFATLKATPSIQAVWQLHKNLRDDGNVNNTTPEYIANIERDCKGEYIKMSVSPDSSSYTVSIPATGFSKTYATKKHG
jgi:beta-lactamase superfamily II metal-dependent hydrolase